MLDADAVIRAVVSTHIMMPQAPNPFISIATGTMSIKANRYSRLQRIDVSQSVVSNIVPIGKQSETEISLAWSRQSHLLVGHAYV